MSPTIVIYGNIASGKSTLARALARALPGWRYLCMDHLRMAADREHPRMDRFALDRHCEEQLMHGLAADGPVIYESSGATMIFRNAMQYIDGRRTPPAVRIRTTCPFPEAMARFRMRKAAGHRQLPPAVRNPMSIEDCWYHFEDRIRICPHITIDTQAMDARATFRTACAYLRKAHPHLLPAQ